MLRKKLESESGTEIADSRFLIIYKKPSDSGFGLPSQIESLFTIYLCNLCLTNNLFICLLFSEEEDLSLSETKTTARIEQPAFKRPRSPTKEEINKDEVNPMIIVRSRVIYAGLYIFHSHYAFSRDALENYLILTFS